MAGGGAGSASASSAWFLGRVAKSSPCLARTGTGPGHRVMAGTFGLRRNVRGGSWTIWSSLESFATDQATGLTYRTCICAAWIFDVKVVCRAGQPSRSGPRLPYALLQRLEVGEHSGDQLGDGGVDVPARRITV